MAEGIAHLEVDPDLDHVRGGTRAAVTLIEYGDYQCPYSRQAFRGAQRAERTLNARLRFVFRHFPLTQIHPRAQAAALAAEAASRQGAFWEMHAALFHGQQALDENSLRGYATQLQLDMTRFDADRRASATRDRVARDVMSGEASGVRGTPVLFLNGHRYAGSYARNDLVDALVEVMGSAGDAA